MSFFNCLLLGSLVIGIFWLTINLFMYINRSFRFGAADSSGGGPAGLHVVSQRKEEALHIARVAQAQAL